MYNLTTKSIFISESAGRPLEVLESTFQFTWMFWIFVSFCVIKYTVLGTSVPNGFSKSCIYPHVMRIQGKVWSEFSPTLVVVLLVVLEWPPEKPSYNLEIALLRSHSRESLRSLNSDLLYGNCCKDDCCSINSKYTTTQQNPISSQIGSSSNFLQHHRSNGWEKNYTFCLNFWV